MKSSLLWVLVLFLLAADVVAESHALFGVTNASVRCRVELNDDTCIPGFELAPGARYRVLIAVAGDQTIGHKVRDALRDPRLILRSITEDRVVAANDDWCSLKYESQEAYEVLFITVYQRFGINLTDNCNEESDIFNNPDNDAAVLRWLDPGEYSVVTTLALGKEGSGGVVLGLFEILEIEPYEVEPL